MNDPSLYEKLQALADGELAGDEANAARELVENDAEAREVYEGIASLKGLLKRSSETTLPVSLVQSIHAEFAVETSKSSVEEPARSKSSERSPVIFRAAAALLLGVLILFVSSFLADGPQGFAHPRVVTSSLDLFQKICADHTRMGDEAETGLIREKLKGLCSLSFSEGVPRMDEFDFCSVVAFDCPTTETRGARIDYACDKPGGKRGLVSVFVFPLEDLDLDEETTQMLKDGHRCTCDGVEPVQSHDGETLNVYCKIQGDVMIHVIGDVPTDRLAKIRFCTLP